MSGSIEANGGDGYSGHGGGGGGGVIAIFYETDQIGGSITAYGGGGVETGGCGPIYTEFSDEIDPLRVIKFDNNNRATDARCNFVVAEDTYIVGLESVVVKDNSKIAFAERDNSAARVTAQVSDMTSQSDDAILYVGNRVLFQLATRGPLANTEYKVPMNIRVENNGQLDLPATTIIERGDVTSSFSHYNSHSKYSANVIVFAQVWRLRHAERWGQFRTW